MTDGIPTQPNGRPQGGMLSEDGRAAYWRMQWESAIGALADLIAEHAETVEELERLQARRGVSVSGDDHGHTNEAVPNINPPTHTIPEPWSDDAFHHEIDEDCACGPESQPVKREDGSVGWVVVHHSLDGREQTELSS